jgi:hypothetical protein
MNGHDEGRSLKNDSRVAVMRQSTCWTNGVLRERTFAVVAAGSGASPLGRGRGRKKEAPSPGFPGWGHNIRQRPTLPRGFPRSTIGSGGLNFRVRDGNGCDPSDIATGKLSQSAVRNVRSKQLLEVGSTAGNAWQGPRPRARAHWDSASPRHREKGKVSRTTN